ncbi:hypothetical protein [Psychromarinibacter sediminicola]|nr:hypothetical protein [Psychromarinibacter sediminicola]
MFETPEARVLLLLRDLQEEMRNMRGELAERLTVLHDRLDETRAHVESLSQEVRSTGQE